MSEDEFKTEQRITNIMKELEDMSEEDFRKIYYAFNALFILKKSGVDILEQMKKKASQKESTNIKKKCHGLIIS